MPGERSLSPRKQRCRRGDCTPVNEATDTHRPGRSCCWQLFTPRRVTNHTPEAPHSAQPAAVMPEA